MGKTRSPLSISSLSTCGSRGPMNNFSMEPWENIIQRICDMRLESSWTPGKKAAITSRQAGSSLARSSAESTGSFDQFVRDKLLVPLDCHNSFVGMPASFFEAHRDEIASMYSTNSAAKSLNTTLDSQWEFAMVAPVRPMAAGRLGNWLAYTRCF